MLKIRDLINVIPCNTPVEIGSVTAKGPFTTRISSFREEVLDKLGLTDREVCLIRLDKQDKETVLRIVIG